MSNLRDMNEPITRREFHETLDVFVGAIMARIDAKFDEQWSRVASRMDAKFEEQRVYIDEIVDKKLDEKLDEKLDAKLGPFKAEMRSLILNVEESLKARMDSLLDPHRDIPDRVQRIEDEDLSRRVSKLETRVFAPKRRAPKTAPRSSGRRRIK